MSAHIEARMADPTELVLVARARAATRVRSSNCSSMRCGLQPGWPSRCSTTALRPMTYSRRRQCGRGGASP